MDIIEELEIYRGSLFDDIIPWWGTYSLDHEYKGYLTRLERSGVAYSYDKDMWMIAREIWMFAHLYNNYEKRESWYNFAELGLSFMLEHGFKQDGTMYFRLDRKGKALADSLSIYTEVFGAIAIAECAHMKKDQFLESKATQMYEFLLSRLGQADDTPSLGYKLLHTQLHIHAHDMCRIAVAKVYKDIWPDYEKKYTSDISNSVNSILTRHWKPKHKYFLENVQMDGTPNFDLPEGRMFHPGHAIESAWMIMEFACEQGDISLFNTAIDITISSLEHAWDKEYGGIRYLTNIDWTPCHNLEADLKLWWPHCEALYALLLSWFYTKRPDILKWYEMVKEYTFRNFTDPDFGEWFGYLNCDGSKVWTAKANGWKGMFHLPRMLFRCFQLLSEKNINHALMQKILQEK